MRRRAKLLSRSFLLFTAIYLSGCATVTPPGAPVQTGPGVYHKVKRGETLWRIAKTYSVLIDEIIRTNNIPNVAKVEENQLVFIPGATAIKEIKFDEQENDKEFVWPVKGKVIRYFHDRKGQLLNQGIDIQVPGGATVKAARSGEVIFADELPGYGQMVILDHGDGFYSVYAQNSKLLVGLGDRIRKSSPISEVENSGDLAYLHFQVRKNSNEENPLYYLP